MNKMIPAALLAAAAGVAQAQMSIYGLIDMSYGKNLADDAANPARKADFHSGGDDGSSQGNSTTRFGIKGSSDLGSGIKGNFKLESGGITSDGDVNPGGAFFNRQAWLGASGSFGEVRLGRQDSVPFQVMGEFDFNGQANMASALGNSLVAPWMAPRGRQSRSLQYMAPAFVSGLTLQAGFQPEDSNDTTTKANFSVAGRYAIGPLVVGAAAETKRTDTGKNFMSVAASYDFKFLKVMGSYADSGSVNGGGSGKGVGLGVVAPVAGFNIGGHFAKNTDDGAKITAIEFFVNREVLKNTYAYFDYGRAENKTPTPSVKADGFALGVIYVF
jgi:predicted porin